MFLCAWLSVYVYHDVCPGDLTKKDWCHTNNILQIHSWWSLVVQVMFHALVTSSMMSAIHKVCQILKLLYLHQYFGYSIDQKLKISEMLMTNLLVYPTSSITSVKKFVATSKWRPFWKIKTASFLPQIWKDRCKLCLKKDFSWWWRHRWRHRVASKSALYIPL